MANERIYIHTYIHASICCDYVSFKGSDRHLTALNKLFGLIDALIICKF